MEKVKRPRPQLSCTPCRNRKLKCDRTSPCSQCIKGKRAHECMVPAESRADSSSARPTKRSRQSTEERVTGGTPFPSHSSRLMSLTPQTGLGPLPTLHTNGSYDDIVPDLLARVKALENAVFNSVPRGASQDNLVQRPRTTSGVDAHPTNGVQQTTSHTPQSSLNVEGSRVRYQGGLHRYALIEQFDEVRAFIPKAIKDAQVAQAIKDLRTLQKSRFIKLDISRRELFTDYKDLRKRALELLPSRDVCLQSLNSYFENWETIFRIVHVVRFRETFNNGWQNDQPAQLDLPILLQLMLMVAIGDQRYRNESLLDADFANNVCALVQGYLDTCSSRIKQDFSTLQIWTLLVLTHQVYLVPTPKLWLETGNLLRHAMAIGLHRDTSEVKTISPYNSELRRRLFATILELDLQASLIYGMPMAVTESDISCQIPSCIPDEKLKQDCKQLPQWTLSTERVESGLQNMLAKSRFSRMEVVGILASRGHDFDSVEVERLIPALDILFDLCLPSPEQLDSGAWRMPSSILGVLLYQTHVWQICSQFKQQCLVSDNSKQLEHSQSTKTASAVRFVERAYVGAANHRGERGPCHQLYIALCRRSLLHAAFVLCSDPNPTNFLHINHVLLQLIDGLPYGDPKDVLLLAITLKFVADNGRYGDNIDAAMMEELFRVIGLCKTRLESIPERGFESKVGVDDQPYDTFALTPDSSSSMFTDDLLGAIEDLTFADLGFGYMDDWQEAGMFL